MRSFRFELGVLLALLLGHLLFLFVLDFQRLNLLLVGLLLFLHALLHGLEPLLLLNLLGHSVCDSKAAFKRHPGANVGLGP